MYKCSIASTSKRAAHSLEQRRYRIRDDCRGKWRASRALSDYIRLYRTLVPAMQLVSDVSMPAERPTDMSSHVQVRLRGRARVPVELQPLPVHCEKTMDMTCAICLEDNTPPGAVCEAAEDQKLSSGMLACGHAFHEECIQKWLLHHDDCPTCKCRVRPSRQTLQDTTSDVITDEDDERLPRPVSRHGFGHGEPMVFSLGRRRASLFTQDAGERRSAVGIGRRGDGLRRLDVGLLQLERSLQSLEYEVRGCGYDFLYLLHQQIGVT